MTKIAYVTGSNGFVGLNLVAELVNQGWEVLALHRRTSDIRYLKRFRVRHVEGDISDPISIARTLPSNVDAVFHAAGDTSLWSKRKFEQNRTNIDGTRNMVECSLKANARCFIHTSSNASYGSHSGTIDESTRQLGETSHINYQCSKFLAEVEVRKGISSGLNAVILNPASIIGPYLTGGYARLFQLVAAGRLPAAPPGKLSFCDARDVARAHVSAVTCGRRGENYLLGGANASLLELVQVIGQVTGSRVPRTVLPLFAMTIVGKMGNWLAHATGNPPSLTPEGAELISRSMYCDCSKAQRELDYQPTPLRTIVEDYCSWLNAEGRLKNRRAIRQGLSKESSSLGEKGNEH